MAIHSEGKPRFSPHARGGSAVLLSRLVLFCVFPACAGVIRCAPEELRRVKGFPRMRGGDPSRAEGGSAATSFSPHARG